MLKVEAGVVQGDDQGNSNLVLSEGSESKSRTTGQTKHRRVSIYESMGKRHLLKKDGILDARERKASFWEQMLQRRRK